MSNKTRVFTREQLTEEFELPWNNKSDKCTIISNDIVDQTRWSVIHDLIFQLPDQSTDEAWMVSYSVGATECQDESPWEYEEEITAHLVVHREVSEMKWILK